MNDYPDAPTAAPTPERGDGGSALLSEVIQVCMAVQGRLGPGCPRSVYADSLIRELRDRGIFATRDGASRPGHFPASRGGGGLRRLSTPCFDLVVEATLAVELTDLSKPAFRADPHRLIGQFEERLRRRELETGLLVDFDQADPTEGIWLARVREAATPRTHHADRETRLSASVN